MKTIINLIIELISYNLLFYRAVSLNQGAATTSSEPILKGAH